MKKTTRGKTAKKKCNKLKREKLFQSSSRTSIQHASIMKERKKYLYK